MNPALDFGSPLLSPSQGLSFCSNFVAVVPIMVFAVLTCFPRSADQRLSKKHHLLPLAHRLTTPTQIPICEVLTRSTSMSIGSCYPNHPPSSSRCFRYRNQTLAPQKSKFLSSF